MKILYSIQATGNGHISRAMEILPELARYGTIDVMLSGNNCHLPLEIPIKYRSKGLSLHYTQNGGLNYWKIASSLNYSRLRKEIRDLPVEKYDLVLNDFDYITAAACATKGIQSVSFGHQASFISNNAPRPPKKNFLGELILKNFARATTYVGLHFKKYDDFIFPPIISEKILKATATNKNHITVYLPAWSQLHLQSVFSAFPDFYFEIFSKEVLVPFRLGNINFFPVSKSNFTESMVSCSGIVTGAGFETPSEALQLGKKLLCVPIRGHYEQQCNAHALKELGVTCFSGKETNFSEIFHKWLTTSALPAQDFSNSLPQCLDYIFSRENACVSRSDRSALPQARFDKLSSTQGPPQRETERITNSPIHLFTNSLIHQFTDLPIAFVSGFPATRL